jgi:hypothetical protein
VVGGLVHQQGIGVGQEGSGDRHPLAVAAGQIPHPRIEIFNTQLAQHHLGAGFQIPGCRRLNFFRHP